MTDIDHAAILRQHANTRRRGHSVNPDVLRAAAAEIERLREQLRLANIDNFNTTAEVDRLRAERDEARRIACEKEAWLRRENGSARDHAERMGWDCFKENTND